MHVLTREQRLQGFFPMRTTAMLQEFMNKDDDDELTLSTLQTKMDNFIVSTNKKMAETLSAIEGLKRDIMSTTTQAEFDSKTTSSMRTSVRDDEGRTSITFQH
eukprot:SAG31_NODE_1856_length_7063_cov_3.328403_1_plen_103_part_00